MTTHGHDAIGRVGLPVLSPIRLPRSTTDLLLAARRRVLPTRPVVTGPSQTGFRPGPLRRSARISPADRRPPQHRTPSPRSPPATPSTPPTGAVTRPSSRNWGSMNGGAPAGSPNSPPTGPLSPVLEQCAATPRIRLVSVVDELTMAIHRVLEQCHHSLDQLWADDRMSSPGSPAGQRRDLRVVQQVLRTDELLRDGWELLSDGRSVDLDILRQFAHARSGDKKLQRETSRHVDTSTSSQVKAARPRNAASNADQETVRTGSSSWRMSRTQMRPMTSRNRNGLVRARADSQDEVRDGLMAEPRLRPRTAIGWTHSDAHILGLARTAARGG